MFIVVFLSILDCLNHFHRTEADKKFLSRAVAEHVAKVESAGLVQWLYPNFPIPCLFGCLSFCDNILLNRL